MFRDFKNAVEDFLNDNREFCLDAFHGEFWGDYFEVDSIKFTKKKRGWGNTPDELVEDRQHFIFSDGTHVVCVDRYGGEGEGDRYDATWKWTNGENVVYTKFSGWYQSFDGSEYEEWYFVEPKQKTITEYV